MATQTAEGVGRAPGRRRRLDRRLRLHPDDAEGPDLLPRSGRADRAARRATRRKYRLGSEALAKDDYARAYQHFENVAPDRDSEELVPQARAKLQKIAELSWERFKEAETLEAAGEPAEAIKAFQALEKDVRGLPAPSRRSRRSRRSGTRRRRRFEIQPPRHRGTEQT